MRCHRPRIVGLASASGSILLPGGPLAGREVAHAPRPTNCPKITARRMKTAGQRIPTHGGKHMKKAIVVLGMVLAAALVTTATWADESDPPPTGDDSTCIACVHACAHDMGDCMEGAAHDRNECRRTCIADSNVRETCRGRGRRSPECKSALAELAACSEECATQFTKDRTACAAAEETCLKDCLEKNPDCQSLCAPPSPAAP